ncbi:DNA helicase RecG, partial [Patescibacteria group bacterium]|nr:DNA helicase RecG [Patescibacteria group bacterium]
GRKEIITKIVKPDEIKQTYQFVEKEISEGRQAFVVCPLIDPSDKLGVKSVKEEYEKLSKKVFPSLKIALLHGKLKPEQKEKIMRDFNKNRINILVSTTVVEVGIDVPNASIIIIEGAERFGLAQLYQLRGRIGRGQEQSYCFLILENEGEKVQKRLQALLQAKNGFELAEKDLELRGPGEIFSTEQSGFSTNLKIARLSDVKIIKETRESAKLIFKQDFDFKKYPLLEKKINESIKITHLE